MSHVATVAAAIKAAHLDLFEQVLGEKFNAELKRDQRTFKMYGSEKAPCIHAITLKNAPRGAYEIGLRYVSPQDHETFELACDFFDGSLARAFGPQLVNLKTEYSALVADDQLSRSGYRVTREETPEYVFVRAMA